jgi:ribosomal protein S18 acetylase RimI-like enzyme
MNGYGVPPVPIHFYREEDREQVRKFRCSDVKPKWQVKPQKIIRSAPYSQTKKPIVILVARDETGVVGVAVIEFTDLPSCSVLSLGVRRDRQNEGIGKSLKRAVMLVASDRHTGLSVDSQVHTHNSYMLRINAGLNAETEPLVDDPDYLATVVRAIPVAEGGVTPSK